jgi:hypothetical protein
LPRHLGAPIPLRRSSVAKFVRLTRGNFDVSLRLHTRKKTLQRLPIVNLRFFEALDIKEHFRVVIRGTTFALPLLRA